MGSTSTPLMLAAVCVRVARVYVCVTDAAVVAVTAHR